MMKRSWITMGLVFLVCVIARAGSAVAEEKRVRFFVASSYHREYPYSQETNQGLCDAMLKFGYLDNQAQADEYTKNDYIESSKAVIKKMWMDTKRKSSKGEMEAAAIRITEEIKTFKPDLLLLGDDNAANYIGNQFLDMGLPIVFWGVNNTPLKYGLVDSIERPGHNVTGVVELGYYTETLQLLKTLIPAAKTFAILSDESETGRSHYKAIEDLAREGVLPLQWVVTASTSEFSVWKQKALELQEKVDAFFIAQFNALKDEGGHPVSGDDVVRWYLTHIKRPEAARIGHFVREGLLCSASQPSSLQGFDAVVMAHEILANGRSPATYPPIIRTGGVSIVNARRAALLGIVLTPEMEIQESVQDSVLPPTASEESR